MRRFYAAAVLVVVIAAAALALAGCKGDVTRISLILDRPERYLSHRVNVAGEVTKAYAADLFITEIGAYQVDDGTGRIWVLSRNGVPREGARIGLRGRVETGVRVGREIIGAVIREEERRTR